MFFLLSFLQIRSHGIHHHCLNHHIPPFGRILICLGHFFEASFTSKCKSHHLAKSLVSLESKGTPPRNMALLRDYQPSSSPFLGQISVWGALGWVPLNMIFLGTAVFSQTTWTKKRHDTMRCWLSLLHHRCFSLGPLDIATVLWMKLGDVFIGHDWRMVIPFEEKKHGLLINPIYFSHKKDIWKGYHNPIVLSSFWRIMPFNKWFS